MSQLKLVFRMFINTFRNFIEIEGLKSRILKHIAIIAGENKRILDLTSKRSSIQAEIIEFEQNIHDAKLKELELEIKSLETNLKKFQAQMDMVKNGKELDLLTSEIKHSQLALDSLEVQYFEKSDLIDSLKIKIQEHKQFLHGSNETLNDIQKEVNLEIITNEKEISNYQLRIDSILELESPSNKNLYLDMSKKFKTTSPCSFIINKNCSVCRINVDSSTANSVESARSIEVCPNCGRILLPKDLNIY